MLSVVPVAELAMGAPVWTDKLVHGTLYAGLTILFAWGYPATSGWILGAALGGYGAVMEGLQLTLPYRSGSAADVVANCAGISIMLLLLTAARSRAVSNAQQQETLHDPGKP